MTNKGKYHLLLNFSLNYKDNICACKRKLRHFLNCNTTLLFYRKTYSIHDNDIIMPCICLYIQSELSLECSYDTTCKLYYDSTLCMLYYVMENFWWLKMLWADGCDQFDHSYFYFTMALVRQPCCHTHTNIGLYFCQSSLQSAIGPIEITLFRHAMCCFFILCKTWPCSSICFCTLSDKPLIDGTYIWAVNALWASAVLI